MKHYLLTLAAAALMAVSASAQVVPASSLHKTTDGINALKGKFTLPGTMVSKAFHQQPASDVALSRSSRITRVSEDERPHQWLSFLDGTETSLGLYPGYYFGLTYSVLTQMGCSGYGFAQFYPSDMVAKLAGNTISGIYFYTWLGTYSNGIVFIKSGSTGETIWEGEVETFNPTYAVDGGYECPLTSVICDYEITGKEGGLIIGWCADVKTDSSDPYAGSSYDSPIMIGLADNTELGYGAYVVAKDSDGNYGFISSSSGSMFSMAEGWADEDGNAAYAQAGIIVETTGDATVKDNDVAVGSLGTVRGRLNSTTRPTANTYITNMGLDPVNSINYTFECDGQTHTASYALSTPLKYLHSQRLPLEGQLATKAGKTTGTLTVTGVNEVDDESNLNNENIGTCDVLTIDGGYKRIPVVEQFTSTYCGFCPRGAVGMKQMKEAHGDDIVLIAAHGDMSSGTDPLTDATYETVMTNYSVSGYPYSLINREFAGDPYYDAPDAVNEVAADVCEASITVTTDAIDSDLQEDVNVKTKIDFAVPVEANSYGLAYVFTEDGITDVDQLNYYAYYYNYYKSNGYADAEIEAGLCDNDPDLVELLTSGTSDGKNYWYQPTFNYVACSITSPMGTEALVPAVEAGSSTTIDYEVTIPSRSNPDLNRENLKMTVLLIDQTSGVIVTGKTVSLDGTESTPSAINNATLDNAVISVADGAFNVKGENAKAEVFTLDGKLVSSCTVNGEASIPTFGKGAFIIRVQQGMNVHTKKAVF